MNKLALKIWLLTLMAFFLAGIVVISIQRCLADKNNLAKCGHACWPYVVVASSENICHCASGDKFYQP